MRIDLRWQLLLAALGLILALSLVSLDQQAGAGCTELVLSPGGRLVVGVLGQPQWLNPLVSRQNPVDEYISKLIFRGLTKPGGDGTFKPDLAESWDILSDGHIVRFNLRRDVTWHDGAAFTSRDVVYTYRLLQEDEFPATLVERELWRAVEINEVTPYVVELELPQPYGPILQATTLGVLPAHLLEGIQPGEILEDDFNLSPVGTGPFMVIPGSNWQGSGSLHLAPNPAFWTGNVNLDILEIRFFGEPGELTAAYFAGDIRAIAKVPGDSIGTFLNLPGIRVFSSPDSRLLQLVFNLSQEDSPAESLELRKALSYGLNRQKLIDGALEGQAKLANGPFNPESWAYNAGLLDSYDYSLESASALLDAAGWGLDEASSSRVNGGIPLSIRILYVDDPLHSTVASSVAEQWHDLGVHVETQAVPFNQLKEGLAAGQFDVALLSIELLEDPDLYDFWSQQAIVDGQNYGGWSNRWASEALENARQLYEIDEREPYYQAFLRYFNEDLPALTLFQFIESFAINEAVKGVEIGHFSSPVDVYDSFQNWTVLEREVTVTCPRQVNS